MSRGDRYPRLAQKRSQKSDGMPWPRHLDSMLQETWRVSMRRYPVELRGSRCLEALARLREGIARRRADGSDGPARIRTRRAQVDRCNQR